MDEAFSQARAPFRRWFEKPVGRPEAGLEVPASWGLRIILILKGKVGVLDHSGAEHHFSAPLSLWMRNGRLLLQSDSVVLALYFPQSWIEKTIRPLGADIPALNRHFVEAEDFAPTPYSLNQETISWAYAKMPAHLCQAAQILLDGSRLTEFFLKMLFTPSTPKAATPRSWRHLQDRVEKVKAHVLQGLDAGDPIPSVEDLAEIVHSSVPYLSRTFSQTEGLSLTLWLRSARISKAASLMSTGRFNVSEAAAEVGYQSLSHFSKAFKEEKGCTPSEWLESSLRS